jgi:superfamily II DNA/RNA helicase
VLDLLDATRLRDQNFVALVLGGGDQQVRERIFAGFNTPLLPEILVCTSVGGEGIDLHRHCRRIVHYDLAWNPAVLEQRTGRVDRIGSKTFREREAAKEGEGPSLEVGVPFLAGTYDERMFEELRMRAQTFKVLTGGDVTTDSTSYRADDVSGADDEKGSEGREQILHLKSLPASMLHDLRAKLHVWKDGSEIAGPRYHQKPERDGRVEPDRGTPFRVEVPPQSAEAQRIPDSSDGVSESLVP